MKIEGFLSKSLRKMKLVIGHRFPRLGGTLERVYPHHQERTRLTKSQNGESDSLMTSQYLCISPTTTTQCHSPSLEHVILFCPTPQPSGTPDHDKGQIRGFQTS